MELWCFNSSAETDAANIWDLVSINSRRSQGFVQVDFPFGDSNGFRVTVTN